MLYTSSSSKEQKLLAYATDFVRVEMTAAYLLEHRQQIINCYRNLIPISNVYLKNIWFTNPVSFIEDL